MSRTAAFHGLQRVGVSLALTREGILLTTTLHMSGLHDAACFLTTPGSIPTMGGTHAGSLPTGWLGVSRVGCEPCVPGSHPLGHDNEFHELSPTPLVSSFLGASKRLLGQSMPLHQGLIFPPGFRMVAEAV